MTLNVLKSGEISLCFSYLYSAVIFLMTAATGSCLCIWCGDSFTQDHDTIGLVKSSCLITGIVMMLFLASWTVFVSLTISSSVMSSGNGSTSKCTQITKKRLNSTRNKRTWIIVFGRLTMTLLLLCSLTELTSLGFMWWTSFSLGDKFQVTNNCFCRWKNSSRSVTTSNMILDQLKLNVSCPEIDDLSCVTVYQEVSTMFQFLPVTIR